MHSLTLLGSKYLECEIIVKQYITYFCGLLAQQITRDVGRTGEEIVSHEPKASDLQDFRVLFQRPKCFIEPINHRNVWYIAFIQ